MKEQTLQTLRDLRAYALEQGVTASFLLHEEDSYLMRFANSAISLNTNEHLIRLEVVAYQDRQRASYELITDLSQAQDMRQALDIAAEMVQHAQPLNYQPTLPLFSESFADESAYDPRLANLSNEDRLAFFNAAAQGLETDEIRLSGIFSCGANTIAQINTRSEHTQYFKTSDAQVHVVLAHATLKWEVIAEQSAQSVDDLDPAALRRHLAFLVARYQQDPRGQLPLGKYDIVFGSVATGTLLQYMNYLAISGGYMKRGFSFLKEEHLGKQVFSDQFTLVDDPTQLGTFPFQRDLMGLPRQPFSLFENGQFQAFTWSQDDADEFGAQATGHTVPHKSLVMRSGSQPVSTLEELVQMPRENDVLYIPYLHYLNIVNPSKGLITASSRFGALLLKKDGSIMVPYNFRITQSLLDLFGEKIAWLSQASTMHNASASYGARNPTAMRVPVFMRVNDLEISHASPS